MLQFDEAKDDSKELILRKISEALALSPMFDSARSIPGALAPPIGPSASHNRMSPSEQSIVRATCTDPKISVDLCLNEMAG